MSLLAGFFLRDGQKHGGHPNFIIGIPYEWIDGHPPAMLGKIACVLMAHQEFDSIPIVPPWYSPQNSIRNMFMYFSENEQMWWILILPLHATSSGVCHFEWRMPLRVAYATSSGVCPFEWRVPLRVAYATSSGVCHFEWRVPLRVAC